ncbi:MAG: O-antigen ligase family protein, partial [Patescibacteria group bacterium]|nr:O-antigen ligase family protein [Patescibacteria group bacterium]
RNFIEFFKYLILIITIVNVALLIKYLMSGTLLQHMIVRFTITESNNPINLARVAGLGVLLWFLSIFQSEDQKYKIIAWFALIPIIISLLATNTRGPILFTLLIILGYLFFYLEVSKKKKIFVIIFLVVIGIALIFILPENMRDRFSLLFQKGNLNIEKNLWMSSSSGRRIIFAKRLLQYLTNHPLTLFIGTGAGGFANLFKDYGAYFYPHNVFLEILFEQGLVGISIFIFSITIFTKELKLININNGKFNELLTPMLFGMIYFFLNAQVSGDIERNRLLWLFWGATIGIMTLANRNTKSISNQYNN